jgi:hypothetical protein
MAGPGIWNLRSLGLVSKILVSYPINTYYCTKYLPDEIKVHINIGK